MCLDIWQFVFVHLHFANSLQKGRIYAKVLSCGDKGRFAKHQMRFWRNHDDSSGVKHVGAVSFWGCEVLVFHRI